MYDIELSGRLAAQVQEGRLPRPFEYVVLSDEMYSSFSESELEHYTEVLSEYCPATVLSYHEWRDLYDSADPERKWHLTTKTDCVNVVAEFNGPFLAKVKCDDGCINSAWHGHKHLLAFAFGKWFHLHRFGEWVG